MKNTIITILAVVSFLAVGSTWFFHREWKAQRKLAIKYSESADSLKIELHKLTQEIQENYNEAEQAYLKSQKELESSLKAVKEKD